jgi:hypothetical protein
MFRLNYQLRLFLLIFFQLTFFLGYGQFDGNQSPEYPKLIAFYDSISKKHENIELYAMGSSDYGLPIYLCVLNGENDSLKTFEKARKSTTLLINNGIHPGEPDGINACGKLTIAFAKNEWKIDPELCIALVLNYNVGGAMNRGSFSRANQNGPEEYGFRGNAKNLDLNRDFIKMDSKNAFTFARIYHALDPDVFIDTHVSNGADYQYVLTLIHACKERLSPPLQRLTYNHFKPEIESKMLQKKIPLIPYVELKGETPESGIEAFNDLPRYAMGYASLFHSISVSTETHMLKGFEDRVFTTREYISEVVSWMEKNKKKIEKARIKALEMDFKKSYFSYNFERTEKRDSILFKGFEAEYKQSEVTGLQRLAYNQQKPYEKYIPHYSTFKSKDSLRIPSYYVLGAENTEVISRLKQNQVEFIALEKDSVLQLELIRIESFQSLNKPYEGHFYHKDVKTQSEINWVKLKKGDIIIPTKQAKRNFILSVLEPLAEDSYFRWNFFDSYLQQKEYFSSYVFEDKAVEILKNNPSLAEKFFEKQKNDSAFASNAWQQLYFIYSNSEFMESSYMRLPIYRSLE